MELTSSSRRVTPVVNWLLERLRQPKVKQEAERNDASLTRSRVTFLMEGIRIPMPFMGNPRSLSRTMRSWASSNAGTTFEHRNYRPSRKDPRCRNFIAS